MTDSPLACQMLNLQHPDDPNPRDVECGKPAAYVWKDGTHAACRECFESMNNDPDIQAEYTPIVSEVDLDELEDLFASSASIMDRKTALVRALIAETRALRAASADTDPLKPGARVEVLQHGEWNLATVDQRGEVALLVKLAVKFNDEDYYWVSREHVRLAAKLPLVGVETTRRDAIYLGFVPQIRNQPMTLRADHLWEMRFGKVVCFIDPTVPGKRYCWSVFLDGPGMRFATVETLFDAIAAIESELNGIEASLSDARGAAAKPRAGVEVTEALAALDDFEHNPNTAIRYHKQLEIIRSALVRK